MLLLFVFHDSFLLTRPHALVRNKFVSAHAIEKYAQDPQDETTFQNLPTFFLSNISLSHICLYYLFFQAIVGEGSTEIWLKSHGSGEIDNHSTMHYGKVSMKVVTFGISNFLPTLEENITFPFYFNDFCLKLPL